jgi:hypothetical protein
VACISEQGKRAGEETGDDLTDHQRKDERKRNAEQAAVVDARVIVCVH